MLDMKRWGLCELCGLQLALQATELAALERRVLEVQQLVADEEKYREEMNANQSRLSQERCGSSWMDRSTEAAMGGV